MMAEGPRSEEGCEGLNWSTETMRNHILRGGIREHGGGFDDECTIYECLLISVWEHYGGEVPKSDASSHKCIQSQVGGFRWSLVASQFSVTE